MTTRESKLLLNPTFWPADTDSEKLVLKLATDLRLNVSTPAKRKKVIVVLSSLLWACEQLRRDGGTDNILGWSHDDKYWRSFPAVGKAVVNEVRKALIDNGLLTLNAAGVFKETMTTYQVHDGLFKMSGSWVQSKKLPVIVKTEKTTNYYNGNQYGGQKLTSTDAMKQFGADLDKVTKQVEQLADFWKKHPLVIDGNQYVAATRVFNDARLDRGGRLYGGWVDMPEATRLTGTIDGEQVAEIDIRGANLTILTGVTGNMMPANPFRDPYSYVDADRQQVKDATLEVLGAGNALKARGSPRYTDKYGKGQFIPVRDKLVDTYPGLTHLEKEVLDSNALAYLESEGIIATIKKLIAKDIPAYPMHDALICKASDTEEAAQCLQDVFEAQCGIRPSLKVQIAGEKERDILGCYTSGTPHV